MKTLSSINQKLQKFLLLFVFYYVWKLSIGRWSLYWIFLFPNVIPPRSNKMPSSLNFFCLLSTKVAYFLFRWRFSVTIRKHLVNLTFRLEWELGRRWYITFTMFYCLVFGPWTHDPSTQSIIWSRHFLLLICKDPPAHLVNSECSFGFWLVCHLLSRDPVWCIFLPWKDMPVRMTDRLLALCENTMIPRSLLCNCLLEKCKSNLVIHGCTLHCNWAIKQADMSSLWLEFFLKSKNLLYLKCKSNVCTQWKW